LNESNLSTSTDKPADKAVDSSSTADKGDKDAASSRKKKK
jgi:hypothetical protein